MKFKVIAAEKANVPVQRACTLLGVSESGYYAWDICKPSLRQRTDMVLLAHIRAQFTTSHETYESPRMTVELKEDGVCVGRHRVARIMHDNGLKALQMLEPGPALAHAIEHQLRPGAVGDVGGCEIDHQQAAIGIDRDVALASNDLLAGVVTSFLCCWSLDRLAIDNPARRARFASRALAVEHQRDIMDRLEHETPDEATKPPIDGLPWREILGQHPPTAARARQITDRVQNLAQIRLNWTTVPTRAG